MRAAAKAGAPRLAGMHPVRAIGSGGFGDVFLYEQQLPKRKVAIKALRDSGDFAGLREAFLHEVNTLARFSSHPGFVTVFGAEIAPDGRPVLIMEYCPGSVGDFYRRRDLKTDAVLKTIIWVGRALSDLHAEGILHRDIKPANILMTSFGWPVLSDFGISAGGREKHKKGDSFAVSVPWSAPEVLRGKTSGSEKSDLWSLAATAYALMEGLNPFESLSGLTNSKEEISRRIKNGRRNPWRKNSVPVSVREIIDRSMSLDPAKRHAGVKSFIEELARIFEARAGKSGGVPIVF